MQKTTKQILGFAGLAVVGVMTATAYYLPTPNVSATDVQITAVIYGQTLDATINYPTADSESASKVIPINLTYSNANKLDFVLTYTDVDGNDHTYTWTESFSDYENGIYNGSVNLTDQGFSYGNYKLEVTAYGRDSTTINDTTRFSYLGTTANVDDVNDDNNNPIIDIKDDGEMDNGTIQVYDKDGNPVFIKDGIEEPIIFDKNDLDNDGEIKIELPMEKYNAPEGEYVAVVTVYDTNGNVIGVRRIRFYYTPKIEVPDTGVFGFAANLSESDIMTAGLMTFVAAVLVALMMMRKQTRKSRR